ncbi:double-strand break repair protein Mre11p [[Candida] railenensis]|uniref:Double-strand break repair protein n=1 Tax=[Candida] railenensis TaxID=45579 RepID=A0A9P0VZQ0_9ASCO|nr:double-strand break repair protein Mre11p [[Candida] railenensis]
MHVSSLPKGPDTVRILITTDNHVGYNENDPIRSDDSWKTFQEITYLAKCKDVDMVLQSGDLFHINKPSKKSMYHVMRSLRLNCMGDRPCELELLSDPGLVFGDGFNTVNYEDPNLNISIPVFAISGNHDDATGEGLLSPMDLLSVAGLVNHFGKVKDNDNITLSPLLFQKGSTKLSLYGLANVRDERLFKSFRDGKVKFLRPNLAVDDWFNLICVHQNHSAHTNTSYLPESFLPSFLDLIIWGHEHECIPYPVHNSEMGFETLQPGSSVATSLSEGEAAEKNVFILNIKGNDYSLETIPLKTVRPFVMEEVSLRSEDIIPGPASKDEISQFLTGKIEDLIRRASVQFKLSNPDLFDDDEEDGISEEEIMKKIPLPLVRLRVEYSGGYEVGNPRRFSNKFVGRVANVNDVVQFYKKRGGDTSHNSRKNGITGKNGQNVRFDDPTDSIDVGSESISSEIHVQELMNEFLKQTQLALLPEDGMNNAVANFLNQEDKRSLKKYIDNEMKQETQLLLDVNIDYDSLHDGNDLRAGQIFKSVLSEIKRDNKKKLSESLWDDIDASKFKSPSTKTKAVSGKESKKRTTSKSIVSDSDLEDEEDDEDDVDDLDVIELDDDDDDDDEQILLSDSEEEEEVITKKSTTRTRAGRAAPGATKPVNPPAAKTTTRKPATKTPRARPAKSKTTKATKPPAKSKDKAAATQSGKRSVLDDLMDI